MGGVLLGFATIAIVIAVGWLLAQLRILDDTGQVVLSKLVFFIASPALMVGVVGRADVHELFSTNLVALACAVAVTAVAQIVISRVVFRRTGGDTVIGAFCSSYVNAGNLGIPIAAYALGDTSAIAPILLLQMIILQPAGLTALDVLAARGRESVGRGRLLAMAVQRPIRNPLTIGSLIGVLIAVTGIHLPKIIDAPLTMIGDMAVPGMLIAYGVSLRTGPLPGRGEQAGHLGVIVVLKLIVQPVAAWLVGAFVLGLHGDALLAVCIIAALPTAQNTFVFAVRYRTGMVLARDSIFLNTILSVPVIIGITALVT